MSWLGHCMVLGEAKCGTSSFHQILVNSGFFAASPVKEVHYFDRACDQSWNYNPDFTPDGIQYQSKFLRAGVGRRNDHYTLDSTPSYFRTPGVAELVVEFAPRPFKPIVLLRDPVTRLYSNYWMLKRRGECGTDDFSTFINTFIARETRAHETKGLSFGYAQNLIRWRAILGDSAELKVLIYEELFSSTRSVLNEVSSYLGIDIQAPVELPRIIPDATPLSIPGNHYLPMRKQDEQRLRDYFGPVNQRLAEILDRDLPWRWRRPEFK